MHAQYFHAMLLRMMQNDQNAPIGSIVKDTPPKPKRVSSLSFRSIFDSIDKANSLNYNSDDDDLDDLSTLDLLKGLQYTDKELDFIEHGYHSVQYMCETMHGKIYVAEHQTHGRVVIKKANKELIDAGISQQDGLVCTVDHNLKQESSILKKAAAYKHPNIVQLVDTFSTQSHIFVVTKYVSHSVSLKQWLSIVRQQYTDAQVLIMMQNIMKQLLEAVRFLHDDLQCCHLNICAENVLIQPLKNQHLRVVLCGFGVAQSFDASSFMCDKFRLNMDDEAYILPAIGDGEIYDARHADMWALGRILAECVHGQPLWTIHQRWLQDYEDELSNAFQAIMFDQLKEYICSKVGMKANMRSYWDLVCQLLQMDESVSVQQAAKHPWLMQ